MVPMLLLVAILVPLAVQAADEHEGEEQLYQPWAADGLIVESEHRPSPPPPTPPLAPGFLSRTLGSNMVLQRAPQQAVIWGAIKAGTVVTTSFGDEVFHTTADSTGVWRQKLPPTPATATPHTITIKATSGETATMENVLFGDVFLCGGQSNSELSPPHHQRFSSSAYNTY